MADRVVSDAVGAHTEEAEMVPGDHLVVTAGATPAAEETIPIGVRTPEEGRLVLLR